MVLRHGEPHLLGGGRLLVLVPVLRLHLVLQLLERPHREEPRVALAGPGQEAADHGRAHGGAFEETVEANVDQLPE